MEKAGIEPARQRLQGATATVAVIPESGPPRVRTGNLRHAMAALCQLELAAHGRRDGARRPTAATQRAASMLTLWSCQCAGTFTRRWCLQGRTESNCHSAGFGDRLPSRWVIPMRAKSAQPKYSLWQLLPITENRPLGAFPGGRFLASALVRLIQKPPREADRYVGTHRAA